MNICNTNKKHNNMAKTTDVLVGMVAGFAAGAAMALLVAPDKGSDTRRKLKKSAKKWGDKIAVETEGLINKAQNKYNKTLDQAENSLDEMEASLS